MARNTKPVGFGGARTPQLVIRAEALGLALHE
jgi:hypothetical protein